LTVVLCTVSLFCEWQKHPKRKLEDFGRIKWSIEFVQGLTKKFQEIDRYGEVTKAFTFFFLSLCLFSNVCMSLCCISISVFLSIVCELVAILFAFNCKSSTLFSIFLSVRVSFSVNLLHHFLVYLSFSLRVVEFFWLHMCMRVCVGVCVSVCACGYVCVCVCVSFSLSAVKSSIG